MKIKDLAREMLLHFDESFELWVHQYSRGMDKPSKYPVKRFGVNNCGQLVLERDWTLTAKPECWDNLAMMLSFLSPEIRIHIGDDVNKRYYYPKELWEVEIDIVNHCIYFVDYTHAEAKLHNARTKAIEKYHL